MCEKSLLEEHEKRTMAFIATSLGVPMTIKVEDKLRGAIVEACMWVRQGAPERALETLEKALTL